METRCDWEPALLELVEEEGGFEHVHLRKNHHRLDTPRKREPAVAQQQQKIVMVGHGLNSQGDFQQTGAWGRLPLSTNSNLHSRLRH